jgi:hypothetical protein
MNVDPDADARQQIRQPHFTVPCAHGQRRSWPAQIVGDTALMGGTRLEAATAGSSTAPNGQCGSGAIQPASGRENLVEQSLGLVLVSLLGQRQLAHQDLPGLGQHALLASGQTAFPVPAPQIAHHLSDLVDVA